MRLVDLKMKTAREGFYLVCRPQALIETHLLLGHCLSLYLKNNSARVVTVTHHSLWGDWFESVFNNTRPDLAANHKPPIQQSIWRLSYSNNAEISG